MGKERVAVYTALYGAYDSLPRPVAQDIPVDFICFTDDPSLEADGWEVRVDPARFEHPRMAAKVHKMLAAEVLPEHRWALWVDANVFIDNPAFAREAVDVARRSPSGVTTFTHPQRDCIYEEAEACLTLPKCEGVPVREQVAAYRQEGHPPHAGLFGCRSIAWDAASPGALEFGRLWLQECERWTYRDQLSFPVVARRLGIQPGTFPYHLFRHRPTEAMACWLGQRPWGRSILQQARRRVPASSPAAAGHADGHPVPRTWWSIGNPWFDAAPHRSDR